MQIYLFFSTEMGCQETGAAQEILQHMVWKRSLVCISKPFKGIMLLQTENLHELHFFFKVINFIDLQQNDCGNTQGWNRGMVR